MPGPLLLAGLSAGLQGLQFAGNYALANKQQRNNMKLAEFQADANERYLQQQLEYNSPKNQMLRFQDAGLNPNLIYGQGNPGSQSAPLQHPGIQPADYQRTAQSMAQIVPMINQTRLIDSQVQAQNARTIHTYAMVELNRLQQSVMEKNPLLDSEGFKAIIDGLKGSAQMKMSGGSMQQSTADWFNGVKSWKNFDGQDIEGPMGVYKLQREVELLDQRFQLGRADQQIKAEVLQSKEFQNAILEIQKKFMTDGEITPQHILQFVQLLLMKLL